MDRREFVKTAAAGSAALAAPGTLVARLPSESDEEFEARMAWWREARFGMFIHWGIYSVLGGEWRGMKSTTFPAEWIQFDKQIPKKEYARLAGRFNPVEFDARAWARLARQAGMKYMVITGKHHDGFCMFDSSLTSYDIMDATPFKRDVIGELACACAEEGVRFGLYYSQLDWSRSRYPYYLYYTPDFKKYMGYMKGQIEELLTNYGPICSLFFDGDWMPQWSKEWGLEVETLCRRFQPGVVINNRLDKRKFKDNLSVLTGTPHPIVRPEVGDYATPEQVIPDELPNCDWETCMTMNTSWGYKSFDHDWKPTSDLIRKLCDICSKGGNFLLNVGPTPEGVIPEPSVSRLIEVGEWTRVNGEAIYGSQAGPIQDAPWGRTTRKGSDVYLLVFDWPEGELVVEGLDASSYKAYLLNPTGAAPLLVREEKGKTIIALPKPPYPACSVIKLKG